MALAAQAQSMQEQLNEQYASSRNTQMEARRKYGKCWRGAVCYNHVYET